MKLIVNRQQSRIRDDGTVVGKGEDALPYVDGQLLMVADGLGGAAAIRHTKFVPELFDGEKQVDALFEGVFDDYSNETFQNYVKESFHDLPGIQHIYMSSPFNMKKSGYFGSRIVSAIFLHDMLYTELMQAPALFETLHTAEAEERGREMLDNLGLYVTKRIRETLKKVSEKANLFYESKMEKLSLLATTLSATVYQETDEYVEAIYFMAGDSRAYIWTEEAGLCQLIADEERADGGMTNYIRANGDFDIKCHSFRFKKPCVLFNASDGCFDSARFMSPMAYEKLLLECVRDGEDPEAITRTMTEFFEIDSGDDSSTMALRAFGYEDLPAWKKACEDRLTVMDELYFSKLEGLLEVSYQDKYAAIEADIPKKLAALKESFESLSAVRDHCVQVIRAGKYEPYNQAINEIDGQIAALERQIEEAGAVIERTVSDHFSKFLRYLSEEVSVRERYLVGRIEQCETKKQECEISYRQKVARIQVEFGPAMKALQALADEMFRRSPSSFADLENLDMGDLTRSKELADEFFAMVRSIQQKNQRDIRGMMDSEASYTAYNQRLAAKNPDLVKRVDGLIHSRELDIGQTDIPEEAKDRIREQLAVISDLREQINTLLTDGKADALRTACAGYWESARETVIAAVAENPITDIPEELRAEALAVLKESKLSLQETREKKELQETLTQEYMRNYHQYMGGDA